MISIYDKNNVNFNRNTGRYSMFEGEDLRKACVYMLLSHMIDDIKSSSNNPDKTTEIPDITTETAEDSGNSRNIILNDYNRYKKKISASMTQDISQVQVDNILSSACRNLTGSHKFRKKSALMNLDMFRFDKENINDYFCFDLYDPKYKSMLKDYDGEQPDAQKDIFNTRVSSFPGKLLSTKTSLFSNNNTSMKGVTTYNSNTKSQNEDGKFNKTANILSAEAPVKININDIRENWSVIVRFLDKCGDVLMKQKGTPTKPNEKIIRKYNLIKEFLCYSWIVDKSKSIMSTDQDYKGYYENIYNLRDITSSKSVEIFKCSEKDDFVEESSDFNIFTYTTSESLANIKYDGVAILKENTVDSIIKIMFYEYTESGETSKARYISSKDFRGLARDFYWLLTRVIPKDTGEQIKLFDQLSEDYIYTEPTVDHLKAVCGLLISDKVDKSSIKTTLDTYLSPKMFIESSYVGATLARWYGVSDDEIYELENKKLRELYMIPKHSMFISDKSTNKTEHNDSSVNAIANVPDILNSLDTLRMLKFLDAQELIYNTGMKNKVKAMLRNIKTKIENYVRINMCIKNDKNYINLILEALSILDDKYSTNIKTLSKIDRTFYRPLYNKNKAIINKVLSSELYTNLVEKMENLLNITESDDVNPDTSIIRTSIIEAIQRGSDRLDQFTKWYTEQHIVDTYNLFELKAQSNGWALDIDFDSACNNLLNTRTNYSYVRNESGDITNSKIKMFMVSDAPVLINPDNDKELSGVLDQKFRCLTLEKQTGSMNSYKQDIYKILSGLNIDEDTFLVYRKERITNNQLDSFYIMQCPFIFERRSNVIASNRINRNKSRLHYLTMALLINEKARKASVYLPICANDRISINESGGEKALIPAFEGVSESDILIRVENNALLFFVEMASINIKA